jgi:hypothetical protein
MVKNALEIFILIEIFPDGNILKIKGNKALLLKLKEKWYNIYL